MWGLADVQALLADSPLAQRFARELFDSEESLSDGFRFYTSAESLAHLCRRLVGIAQQ